MTLLSSSSPHRLATLSLLISLLALLLPAAAATTFAQDEPIAVSGPFEEEGESSEADAVYEWAVPGTAERWRIEVVGNPEETIWLALLAPDGERIEQTSGTGRAVFPDLSLAPGMHVITVPRTGRENAMFRLRVTPETKLFDAEPNDRPEGAVPIADGDMLTGRLGRTGHDEDLYRLRVGLDELILRDIHLETQSDRQLCLQDLEQRDIQCRRGSDEVALTDLLLDPGEHLLSVRGSVDENAPYELRVGVGAERPTDYEAEPNDAFTTASSFDATLGVTGRSSRADHDYHSVNIDGEPQLWRVEAAGDEIDQLAWVRGDGSEVALSRPGCDGSTAVLNDLYLVPGSHHFRVRTCTGEYKLTMTPLGERDPEAEREPNSDEVRAEPYAVGQRRTGRLATDEDVDYLRFTLAAPEHFGLRLDQPPDGDLDVRLWSGTIEILRQRASAPGADLELDLWLNAGDYLMALRPLEPAEGTYELTTERLDPFVRIADQEPNDTPGYAGAAPASLSWEGTPSGGRRDIDGYWLPPLTEPGPISIRMDTERPVVRLMSDAIIKTRIDLVRQEDGTFVADDAPIDIPLYLEVQADEPYRIDLDAPGWTPVAAPAALLLELSLDLETDLVAAYWPQAQRVEGALEITNMGAEEITLDLKAITSHYAWTATPKPGQVAVAPDTSVKVPLTVAVQPDVWADAPVQVSVAAMTLDCGIRTATTLIDGDRNVEAVGSHVGWAVPDALLGGLNVAGAALGAEPLGSIRLDREIFLYDDVTPAGTGFYYSADALPLEIVVDLAGDAPVAVAGTILNPLAAASRLQQTPRDFELLLSTDGVDWRSVYEGELQPLPIDQPFVFDDAVPATHAMLRIKTLHGDGRSKAVALGEWKVIAEPGAVPDSMPDNIAAPVRGGHVVSHAPFVNGFPHWYGMLDDDSKRRTSSIDHKVDEELQVVIGFQDGRAAHVIGLRWRDPDGSLEESRAQAVDIEVSTDGPLGPWEDVGEWVLQRHADGSVAPYDFDGPTWARYVRLTSDLPAEEVRQVEFPATVEVIERPTAADYRSILGEWGYTSRLGPLEWLESSASDDVALGPDAGDTRAQATPLELGATRADRAEILEDVDWFRIDVPADANTLTLDLEGVPTVGVGLTLFDADGTPREVKITSEPGGILRHEAMVEPGASYDVLVEQPPFNVVFTFDTSGSMGPYLDFVLEGMREFAADVEPGREVAMIVPFEQPPLLDAWQDQPIILEDAVNGYVPMDPSSDAEKGLLAASALLEARDGARAILVVTDAETGSLDLGPDVWSAFDAVQPTVYAVHVGADGQPEETRNLMRAWADSAGGHYAYPTTHAEADRAFERMSTRLRRPSRYTLTTEATEVNRDPAMLSVVAPPGQPAALAPGVGVEIILDTSGSMRKKLEGAPRIDIAKASLRELVSGGLAEGVPVAVRTFGGDGSGKAARCETRLSLPLGPLDKAQATKLIKRLKADKRTRTPIAAAIAAVASDLETVSGSRTVVLVTDGDETCKGDPDAAIEALRDSGIDVNLNIVGFALEDETLKEQMATWAEAGSGTYFDASGAGELAAAIARAVAAPFRVYGPDAEEPLVTGTVGGDAVELEPGTYRVEVLTDPAFEFEDIELGGGEARSIVLVLEGEES